MFGVGCEFVCKCVRDVLQLKVIKCIHMFNCTHGLPYQMNESFN